MWHLVAPRLAQDFTVVAPDLRGYGDSAKPPTTPDHEPYSKRAMARAQVALMRRLGFERFAVAGHDRGGRVAYRLALDHPERVQKLAVLDIVPTGEAFRRADMAFGLTYYHWFFLAQPYDLPERLIGSDPEYYIRRKMAQWSGVSDVSEVFADDAFAEYLRCFSDPATIHASCEDYRAAATIDLEHDEADMDRKISCPLLALWGAKGIVGRKYDVLGVWRERAMNVSGKALPCGHWLTEEVPELTLAEVKAFLASR